jgi:alpha-tubulin suppressor-like RCC1 family protein
MANVSVIALEKGHDGRALREAGEVFEVDSKRLSDGSTWFRKAKANEVSAEPAAAPEQTGDVV